MTTRPETLLLIDVMPLLYRGHFAFASRPRMTSDGVNTSAIFIFTSQVLQIMQEQNATHVALAMDSVPTFRHEKFPDYKAQREKMPEDIGASIPMAEEFAKAMNLPFLRVENYEADDVIGTLAARGEAAGMRVCLYTSDKDFAQLVTPNISLYRPSRGEAGNDFYGVDEVNKVWELESPAQMVELLGLAGDTSDNIPGIPGVGAKTAAKLLRDYKDIEGVLAHAEELKGKLRERVLEHGDKARLSRWLAEIRKDAPVEVGLDELRRRAPDVGALAEFCRKYELLSLQRKLLGDAMPANADLPLFAALNPSGAASAGSEPGGESVAESDTATGKAAQGVLPLFGDEGEGGVSAAKDGTMTAGAAGVAGSDIYQRLSDLDHDYRIVESEEALVEMLAELSHAHAWAFDTETTGLEPWKDRMLGISFCATEGRAWYLPMPADEAEAKSVIDRLRPLFECGKTLKIGHNLKFDLAVLRYAGLEVAEPLSDTMLAHYVCEPAERHGLDFLAKSLLRYEPLPITDLIGERGPDQLTMEQVPLERAGEYAAEDADVTLRLHSRLQGMVEEAGARDALDRCENALVPVLLDMECEGVQVDADALRMYSAELAVEIQELERKVLDMAGVEFNLASPKQLGTVLFEHLKLPPSRRTRTGQYETSEEVLTELSGQHPIIALMLEYRACTKLKSTYVDKLPAWIRPTTGRVHTTFNQALTETGRLSSDRPNLQNIPIRTERGKRIRAAFVARDADHVLISADYSQVELRVMAALSGDESMIEAFKRDADIHRETAARVHGIESDSVTSAMRDQAKMVNFGIIYGISTYGLSQRLGVPRKQAGELIETYFQMYPAIKRYMDRTIEEARANGYVTTLLGRRRVLRDIASRNGTLRSAAERIAINTPVQGTAADLIKLAMVCVHREIVRRGLKARLVLQVHDELLLDTPRNEADEVKVLVARCMSEAMELPVPLKVDVGIGDNWLQAH